MTNKRNKQKKEKKDSLEEIKQIDQKIIRLLEKRVNALKMAQDKEKKPDLPFLESEQEKTLWKYWHTHINKLGLDTRILRKVFNLVNNLVSYHWERTQDRDFVLRPKNNPVQVEIQGPRDRLLTKMWLVSAAAQSNPISLYPVVFNDPLFELIKALNQAEGDFSWDRQQVVKAGNAKLDFHGKTIFSGQDSFNLYALIFLALLEANTCKFTGGSQLKILDMDPLYHILNSMGARMVNLIPGSNGLPIRLESNGTIDKIIHLPENASGELVVSLALCASSYHQDLQINFSGSNRYVDYISRLEKILGTQMESNNQMNNLIIKANHEQASFQPDLPLDPVLNAYILALPLFINGQVRLKGEYPLWLPEGKELWTMLEKSGLKIEHSQDETKAQKDNQVSGESSNQYFELECLYFDRSFPLAFALATTIGPRVAIHIQEGQDWDFAKYILTELEIEYVLTNNLLQIKDKNFKRFFDVSVTAPNSNWILSLALIALVRPNIILKNPGEMTRAWPQFWSFLKGLPVVEQEWDLQTDKGDKKAYVSSKKRRIVE